VRSTVTYLSEGKRLAATNMIDDAAGHHDGGEKRSARGLAPKQKRGRAEKLGNAHGVHEPGCVAETFGVRDLELGRRELLPGRAHEDRRKQEPERTLAEAPPVGWRLHKRHGQRLATAPAAGASGKGVKDCRSAGS